MKQSLFIKSFKSGRAGGKVFEWTAMKSFCFRLMGPDGFTLDTTACPDLPVPAWRCGLLFCPPGNLMTVSWFAIETIAKEFLKRVCDFNFELHLFSCFHLLHQKILSYFNSLFMSPLAVTSLLITSNYIIWCGNSKREVWSLLFPP